MSKMPQIIFLALFGVALSVPGLAHAQDSVLPATLSNAVVSSNAFTGELEAVEGVFTAPLASLGGAVEGEVVHLGRGCPAGSIFGGGAEDLYLSDPTGRIALIERGACRFDHKIARAFLAGAIAAIVYNDAEETLVTMAGDDPTIMPDGTLVDVTIPAVFVQRSTGLLLRDGVPPVTARIQSVTTFEALDGAVRTLRDAGLLNNGQMNALLAKLANAQRQAAAGRIGAARGMLTAFINQVQDFVSSGLISESDGEVLLEAAQAIVDSLGG